MGWIGTLLGGGLGYAIGGPLGGIIGMVLGDNMFATGGPEPSAQEKHQSVFFVATFSMLGKLSKADGLVNQDEIDAVERVMRDELELDAQSRQLAILLFNQAKDTADSFDDYAYQFYQEFQEQPDTLGFLIDLLLLVAYADGEIDPEEQSMIWRAVEIFNLEHAYEQIEARHSYYDEELDRYYEILGARDGESLVEIKRKYRKLAMEYHPDRVKSRGVSPEFAAAAEARFKDIQHAFDVVEQYLKQRDR